MPELLGFFDEEIEWLDAHRFAIVVSAITQFEGKEYLAVKFQRTAETPYRTKYDDISQLLGLILVYELDGDHRKLLGDTRQGGTTECRLGCSLTTVDVEEWGDLNKDGLPDLIMHFHQGGNGALENNQVRLWQVDHEEGLVDLTKPVYEKYKLVPQRSIKDRNGDGILDIWVADTRGAKYASSQVGEVTSFKIYNLVGDEIEDISSEFSETYDEMIFHARKYIEDSFVDDIVSETEAINITYYGYAILLHYENSDRREEGCRVYQELFTPSNWSNLSPEASEVMTWRWDRYTEQCKTGEPF